MITIFLARTLNLNRSYTVIYDEISRRTDPDMRIVYVSMPELTIEDIVRLGRESDWIVIDNAVWVARLYDPGLINSAVFPRWRGARFYQNAFEALMEIDAPRLYVASGWDLHWPGPEIDALLPRIDALAWMFEKRPMACADVPLHYREPWMDLHDDPLRNWEKTRRMVPIRIELVHSLGSQEFLQRPNVKWWDTCVVGDSYRTRLAARDSILREDLSIAPFRSIDQTILRMTHHLAHMISPEAVSGWCNRMRQIHQVHTFKRSRTSFVCGSGLRYLVRKFFEVPAAWSATLAYPSMAFEHFGFRDGENVIITSPEDSGKTVRTLLNHRNLLHATTKRGWEMVRALHSVEKRATDFIECLRRLRKGTLRCAEFVDGRYEIT